MYDRYAAAEVESVLHAHPAVKQAAVFGTPHPVMGEVVQAVVTLKVEAEEAHQAIIQHCRRTLSGYKVPANIHVMLELPTNASGKIMKRKLRWGL